MAQKAKITVHPSFTVGEISPRLFSTFLEPIGTMVNGTMFNPKHPTANAQGFRQDFIDALKKTGMPACRLPGGNFVSGWEWKDSIGPKELRKKHLDLAWYQYITNEVGHDEYLQWAEQVGTEAMYTINLGTGDIKDAQHIVEYTNHPGGTYWSDLRREYGHENPYDVKTWYLGNEMDGPWQIGSWGQNPKGYGILCNEVSKVMKWTDARIETAVCASSSLWMNTYPQWEEDVLQECYDTVDYISMHHYHAAPPGDYKALLGGSHYYEDFINTEIALCDLIQAKHHSPKKMMLSFDEYGGMIRPNEALHPGYGPYNMAMSHYRFNPDRKYILHDPDNMPERMFPGSELLQALSMASIQLAFLRHADRVKIGCMTGGLGALCASNHDHVWKSASHHIFMQMMQYAKGTSLQVDTSCETYDIPGYFVNDTSQYMEKEGVPYVDTAAAYDADTDSLTIFAINRNAETSYPVELDIRGFEGFTFDEQIVMYCEDLSAKNSFEDPNVILPKTVTGQTFEGGKLTAEVQPLSWNVFRFKKM